MSQYSRPLGVLVGAPVTFVGPLVAGFFAGALWTGGFWATTALATASTVMERMRIFIVPLYNILTSAGFFTFVLQRIQNSCGHTRLPSFARLGRARAPVPTRPFKPAQSHQFQWWHLSEAGIL